jgi:hypothetical protein
MNILLIVAGTFSAIAALIHLGCIYFGASWYRFFGAGEHMAVMSEQGSVQPTVITSAITIVLVIWSFYAYSAAGLLTRLPLVRTILVIVSTVYLLRALVGFFLINHPLGRSAEFWMWSSSICLVIAMVHIMGLKQVWTSL